jgi:hypothetical protein
MGALHPTEVSASVASLRISWGRSLCGGELEAALEEEEEVVVDVDDEEVGVAMTSSAKKGCLLAFKMQRDEEKEVEVQDDAAILLKCEGNETVGERDEGEKADTSTLVQ